VAIEWGADVSDLQQRAGKSVASAEARGVAGFVVLYTQSVIFIYSRIKEVSEGSEEGGESDQEG
jgi:hypothetical protein